METKTAPETFTYEPGRHGGWYVNEVRYPSGAVGCVSRNYPDKKWRIACDERPGDHTYRTRDEAARAEWEMVESRGWLEGKQRAIADDARLAYDAIAPLTTRPTPAMDALHRILYALGVATHEEWYLHTHGHKP
jgi:hypothetical protein